MLITLNKSEIAALMKQDPRTKKDGGYQGFLVSLQEKLMAGGNIELTPEDLEKIPRYAYDYGNGGWEDRLTQIFQRHLGSRLGR